jgi:hypothetical protein
LLPSNLCNVEIKQSYFDTNKNTKDLKRIQIITFKFYTPWNTVQLIGHVGQDPEVKNLEGGKKLANLSIATNEVYYKENGDKVEKRMAS